MTTLPSVKEQFEEEIKKRLREDIGKLIPDAALSEMVKKAINDMFFTRVKDRDRWGTTTEKPSWFEEECGRLLSGVIREEMEAYVKDNREEFAKAVLEGLTKALPHAIADWMVDALAGAFHTRSMDIADMVINSIKERQRY